MLDVGTAGGCLLLGRLEDHQHLADLGAGVPHGLVHAAYAVETVARVEDGLAVLGLEGHLAGEDVVDGFHGVGGELGASAGHEVGDAHDDLAALDVVGAGAVDVVQTGGDALIVAGGGISVNGAALHTLGPSPPFSNHYIEYCPLFLSKRRALPMLFAA